jgi:hypothetical protein
VKRVLKESTERILRRRVSHNLLVENSKVKSKQKGMIPKNKTRMRRNESSGGGPVCQHEIMKWLRGRGEAF